MGNKGKRVMCTKKSVGFVTGRDHLNIKFTTEEILNAITNFSQMDEEMARNAFKLGKDSRDWKIKTAQKDILNSGITKQSIKRILYRPFDIRYTYYTGTSSGIYSSPQY